jgi:signal transduction histidine kinase/CheY-like chemotaxis protein
MEIKQWNQELASLLVIPTEQQKATAIASKCKELLYEGDMKKAKSEGKELWRDAVAVAVGDLPPSTLGTTLVNGRYLEWKGSRSTWDQEDVCILTVRDSTNWILMQEQTKRESASKTALLRSVSHELRTPLNAVINLVRGIMEEELLSPKSAEDLLLVSSCSHFLVSMINDLLDYSKLIAGKFALAKSWFPLRGTIEQSVKLFAPQCKAKGVDLHLNIDTLLPEAILSDSNRFKQVLLNLISNAVKFTTKGHIRVIALNAASNKLRIDVIDTGIGIAKVKQGRLFQLFGKLEGNEEINPQGSGLGLNIANALANELGGRQIELQSEENEGSTFSFFTDMREEATQTSPFFRCNKLFEIPKEICSYIIVPKLMKSENCCARQQPAPDILLVDDAEFNRLVLRRMLKSLGLNADEAVNGRHALIKIRKAYSEFNLQYKLVLMDLEMPEMDGLTAVREIQGLVARGDLPVAPIFVACSAYSAREDKDLCFRAGMSAYLEKPISKENLSSTISSFL